LFVNLSYLTPDTSLIFTSGSGTILASTRKIRR